MKTQLSKPSRTKARYTEEYKQEALELWRNSGRSAAKVAAELGIRALAKATAMIMLLLKASLAASNTNWFATTASSPSANLALPSSITPRASTTAPDSTPVLITKAQPILNPN